MANKISVVIDVAVDKANRAFTDFKTKVSDADGAVGKFKAGAASASDSLKANIMPVAAAAGAAVVAFAAKSVKAASDLSESTNAVNVSFGKSAEGVLEIGENAAESMGLSKSAFNEAAVGFAAFAENIAGPGGDAADVIGELTGRASDFASVMNLDATEAANVFRSALSGETEPIKKFGIDLSAAAVEAHALASGMVDSKKEMTEAIKVQARYSLLMAETSKFAGDFAKTSDGLANSSRIAAARMEDLQATIGTQLLPIVEDATGLLLGLADAIEAVGNNAIVQFGSDLGLFNNIFGVTMDLWDKGPGSLIAMASATDDATDAIHTQSQSMVQASVDSALLERKRLDLMAAEESATEAVEAATEAAEAQAEAVRDLIAAREDEIDATLNAGNASLSYRQQVADTTEAIAEATLIQLDAKRTDEERAQAARDAEAAVYAQADAAVAYAEDQAAANGATLTAYERAAIYRGELQKLADKLDGPAKAAIEAHIASLARIPKSIATDIAVRATVGYRGSPAPEFHDGGVVGVGNFASDEVPAVLQKGEMVLTEGQQASVASAMAAGGGNTYNITVTGLTGPQVADELVNKIMEYRRRNGGLPW